MAGPGIPGGADRRDVPSRSSERKGMGTVAASIVISAASMVILSSLSFLYLKNLDDLARLACHNDTERTFSTLWESLRDHDDFGQGAESIESLNKKVLGIGIYDENGSRIFEWGISPVSLAEVEASYRVEDDSGRGYIEKPRTDSMALLLHPMRMNPRPPPREPGNTGMGREREGERERERMRPEFFDILRKGSIIYLEVKQEAFWRGRRLRVVLFPVLVTCFAAGVLFVRSIFLRNLQYRRRIEEQENLVILGTAASTLAHEIKTPLHSIRLQTGIIGKSFPEGAAREIRIINEEVERLALLSYRMNDYIREPVGNPVPVDPSAVAREAGLRAFGRDVVEPGHPEAVVSIDPERLRSVLANLLRNAAESGSPEDEVRISVSKEAKTVRIDVLDRGEGVAPGNRAKLFKAFFTTKSRGSGIGLPICRRFVEGAGGRISLDPRAGGGSRVRIELPEAES